MCIRDRASARRMVLHLARQVRIDTNRGQVYRIPAPAGRGGGCLIRLVHTGFASRSETEIAQLRTVSLVGLFVVKRRSVARPVFRGFAFRLAPLTTFASVSQDRAASKSRSLSLQTSVFVLHGIAD